MTEAMRPTEFSITIEIRAPPKLVWLVITDVARWPDWTASVARMKLLTTGPLRIGSRVRIHQPQLPPASWRVTDLDSGKHFTWVSVAPGVRVPAQHAVEATTNGCSVTLSVNYKGFLGRLLAHWTRNLNDRYLAMEANGLKACCERRAEM
jgi:uncharacterized membrane protein